MKARQLVLTTIAASALTAPAAQAMLSPDGGGTPAGTAATAALPAPAVKALGLRYQAMAGAYRATDARHAALQSAAASVRHREIARNTSSSTVASRPDDRAGVRGVGGAPVRLTGSSFDWTWIAAGSSSGFVLLLAGGAFLVAFRRHPTIPLGA